MAVSDELQERPLRVLLTTPNLDTAGSKYIISDLVQCFQPEVVRPSLCVHRQTNTALEVEVRKHVDTFMEIPLRIPTRPLANLWKETGRVAKQLRGRFDLVHSFDYASGWSEGVIMRRASIPWVVDKTNFSWGTWRWSLRSLLARRIFCKSHNQYSFLFKGGIFSSKASVVHNGVVLSRFGREVDRVGLAEAIGVPADGIILGCVAHLVPVKGHVELLRAFAQVARDRQGVYLVLVGAGDCTYEAELESLVGDLALTERVRFLGRRSDVPTLMGLFDGFVLPTRDWGRREAFGVVLVEAMASGLPVIATRSGGPEDIVLDQETGWLVSAEGVEPLVGAMQELLADEPKRVRFGKAGKERAKQLFSLETMVQRYQDLYLEVCARSGPLHLSKE